jgi:hypothetical protein
MTVPTHIYHIGKPGASVSKRREMARVSGYISYLFLSFKDIRI